MTPTDAKHPNERPRHWHPTGELQLFLTGDGLLLDADGNETPVSKAGPKHVTMLPPDPKRP